MMVNASSFARRSGFSISSARTSSTSEEFSLRFKRSRVADAPPLSPLPKLRAHPQSPCRKISDSHSVFIRPLKANPNDVVS